MLLAGLGDGVAELCCRWCPPPVAKGEVILWARLPGVWQPLRELEAGDAGQGSLWGGVGVRAAVVVGVALVEGEGLGARKGARIPVSSESFASEGVGDCWALQESVRAWKSNL